MKDPAKRAEALAPLVKALGLERVRDAEALWTWVAAFPRR
jgi:hypothetical protein